MKFKIGTTTFRVVKGVHDWNEIVKDSVLSIDELLAKYGKDNVATTVAETHGVVVDRTEESILETYFSLIGTMCSAKKIGYLKNGDDITTIMKNDELGVIYATVHLTPEPQED